MSDEMVKRADVRTTISLAPEIWEIAQHQMRAKGFNDNISQYIRDLIWRDKEATELRALQLQERGSKRPTRPTRSVSYRKSSKEDTGRKIVDIVKRKADALRAERRPK